MTPPSSVEPELLTAALPGGWEAVTGPGIAIAVELSPGDPRLPHLRAAVGLSLIHISEPTRPY